MQKTSSKSMIPLILPDDEIVVEKAEVLDIDDIVVFKRGNRLIAHRVVHKTKDGSLITKGDNNRSSDGKIKEEQILGKVKKIKRNGKTVSLSHIYLTQSSTYMSELKKIVSRFKKLGIDLVILKGLPVHIYVNKKPPKRLYLDIDILVRKKDFSKVKKALSSLDFKKQKSKLFGKEVKNATQITFAKNTPQFPTVLDLHLEPAIGFTRKRALNKLLPDTRAYTDYLFKNKKHIKTDKANFPVLDNEALFSYLLLHFFHHNLQGTHRANLIKELAEKKKISWKKVEAVLEKCELENLAYISLESLAKHFNLKTPLKFERKLSFVPSLVSPFNQGGRYKEALKRIILIFLFSPKPFFEKLSILFRELFV
jgi:signal peptidase I